METEEISIEYDQNNVENNLHNNTNVVVEGEETASEDDQDKVSENINNNDNVIEESEEVNEDVNVDVGNIVEEVFVMKKNFQKS